LQYFITDLFEKITIYNSKITDAKRTAADGGYDLDLTVQFEKNYADSTGKEVKATGESYVEVGVYKNRSELISLKKYKLHEGLNKLKIAVKERPYKLVLDPRCLLIDKNLDDNEFKVGKPSELAKLSRKGTQS
jgi:ABC-2 type transport system permease protein